MQNSKTIQKFQSRTPKQNQIQMFVYPKANKQNGLLSRKEKEELKN